jgi:hypothetical protein
VSGHYEKAEVMLEEASDPADHGVLALHAHIALAQVHATLALIDTIRELVKEAE